MGHDAIRERLVAQAEATKAIIAAGAYRTAQGTVDLHQMLEACRDGTRLLMPGDWDGILARATALCRSERPAPLAVTAESTLAALERLTKTGGAVAALNFASARRLGGGWDSGARAQEETLARASGLTVGLAAAPGYYAANRQHDHLFYTDHAIWSPVVPFFTRDDGTLLDQPYTADVITMPAPNIGAMTRPTESDLRGLRGVWLKRIRCVLALAVTHRVDHLILGAWGCGAFGNDPVLVADCFREALEPWTRGLGSLTFAIYDNSRSGSCIASFTAAFAPEAP